MAVSTVFTPHSLAAALAAALSLGCAGAAIAAEPVEPSFSAPSQGDPNRVWIRYAAGQKAGISALIQQQVGALHASVAAGQGARAARAIGATTHYQFDDLNAVVMTLPSEVLAQLRKNKNLIVEQDVPRYPMAEFVPYGVPQVQAPDTVAAGADGSGVKVCVIDSGLRATHEDFAGIGLSGNAASGRTWNTDTCGHGTHVAGTIAAVGGNGKGVIGVSPGKVSLHIVKYFDGASCGVAYSSGLVDAARRCQQAGAKVINMSLGGALSSTSENTAFTQLFNQGVLSVAAAGNSGNSSKSYPASYANVLSVAAVDSNRARASFSQFNDAVDIAAPGVDVSSTYPKTGTALQVGTARFENLPMVGTATTTVSGALADGGRCLAGGGWSGRVVLCERGENTTQQKIDAVKAGGGVGIVLYNNVADPFPYSTGVAGSAGISGVAVSQGSGAALRGLAGQVATLNPTTVFDTHSYAVLSGTSMASPHVAGVAALLFAAKPSATAAQVRDALTATALDLGAPGRDNEYGFGMVRAFEALDRLTATGTSAN
ncbi:S8 family serine peptidase [Lysobacter enzymogenes]|uniref:S8 family serine peptidase n=1 Tax=Lysobacter enzymogenes TaxID=69 RepID=UPI00089AB395|nr:S8 family serine peptidase [Lysobacter enzymogenes]SDX69267.1 PA domain-containing protein [Lysobacter enzymogenes]